MITDVDISTYNENTVSNEILQDWFERVNLQHACGKFPERASAVSYYSEGVFTYRNSRLPGDMGDAEPLYMSLVDDNPNSPLVFCGPSGVLLCFLGVKPFKKDISATTLLRDFLRKLYPESVIGGDELFVWFNTQLINTYCWNDQGILTIRVRGLTLPDNRFTVEEVFKKYLNYLCEHLEYQE